jgi:hypothetical protein
LSRIYHLNAGFLMRHDQNSLTMIRFQKLFILSLLLISIAGCRTPQPVRVSHVSQLDAGHNRQGFFYSLPRNIVIVDVAVIRTDEIPGPFAQFAGKYLGLDNVIERQRSQYVIKDISVNSYAETDPTHFYFVEWDSKRNPNLPFSIMMNEGGTISAINTLSESDENRRINMQKNIPGFYGNSATFNHFLEINLQERIDTILERVRVDTTTVERRTLRRIWVEKTSEVRAREISEYILRIRNKRFEIISGFAEVPYSKDAIQYMNEQLLKMENDHLELFTGITQESVVRYRYIITPDKNTAGQPITLFYFDRNRGVQEQSSLSAETMNLTISRDFTTRQMGVFIPAQQERNNTGSGFFYRIPEHANIALKLGNKSMAESRLLISQFGVVTHLPLNDFMIEFYPGSGTIKSVERLKD